jgi:phosphatidylglycerophosphate synthase
MTAVLFRRELATRHAAWAKHLAARLGDAGVTPNAVSVTGLGFAAIALAAFAIAPHVTTPVRAVMLLAAAAAIQLRLLCNLLDGMLAVEEGMKTATGELFNEIPDRLADVLILVGAGSCGGAWPAPALGWAAAATALFTAYVRVLGGSLGVTQHFVGPMAKQHRMFVLTIATMSAAAQTAVGMRPLAIPAGLIVIVAGGAATAWRRVRRIARELHLSGQTSAKAAAR